MLGLGDALGGYLAMSLYFPKDQRRAVTAFNNTVSESMAVVVITVVAEIAAQSILSSHGVLLGCPFHLLLPSKDMFSLYAHLGQHPVPWDRAELTGDQPCQAKSHLHSKLGQHCHGMMLSSPSTQ